MPFREFTKQSGLWGSLSVKYWCEKCDFIMYKMCGDYTVVF